MQLTKQQVEMLKRYQIHREVSPTFLAVLRRSRRWPWVVLAVCVAFGLMAVAPQASPRYGWFLLGLIVGSVYISLSTALKGIRQWPLSREIINWKRVDELVRENEDPPA